MLYVSFGVVKGRLGSIPSVPEAESPCQPETVGPGRAMIASQCQSESTIEITDATVEHYSSHLPTASFGRLFIRAADINGFALESSQSQG